VQRANTDPPDDIAATRQWHALSAADALAALSSAAAGLDGAEAKRRLAELGPNLLPQAPGRSWAARLLAQIHNVLIYVLFGAAALSFFLGHPVDGGVILAVIVVNAAIGFVQEGRAENALEAIRGLPVVQELAELLSGRPHVGGATRRHEELRGELGEHVTDADHVKRLAQAYLRGDGLSAAAAE